MLAVGASSSAETRYGYPLAYSFAKGEKNAQLTGVMAQSNTVLRAASATYEWLKRASTYWSLTPTTAQYFDMKTPANTPTRTEHGYDEQQQRIHAQMMHAMIGNIRRGGKKRSSKKKVKIAVAQVLRSSRKKGTRKRRAKIAREVLRDAGRGYGLPNPDYQLNASERKATGLRQRSSDEKFMDAMTGITKAAGDTLLPGLGTVASHLLSSIAGFGDYTEVEPPYAIESNTLMGRVTPEAAQIPSMHEDGTRVRISHREYITDLTMTPELEIVSRLISPTNVLMFPWLAPIAAAFQQWRPMGLVYELRSLSANAISGTVAGMGSIVAAVRYDVYSNQPSSKSEIANSMYAVSCKPSENMMIPVECAPDQTQPGPLKVLAPGLVPPNMQDYAMGYLDIATVGAPNTYTGAAEIWATYDIVFFKPRVSSVSDGGLCFALDLLTPTSSVHFPPNVRPDLPQPYINTLGADLASSHDAIYLSPDLPAGIVMLCVYEVQGPAPSSIECPSIGLSGGLESSLIFTTNFGLNTSSAFSYPGTATNDLVLHMVFALTYDGTGTVLDPPTLQLTEGVFPASSAGSFMIFVVNSLVDVELYQQRLSQKVGGPVRACSSLSQRMASKGTRRAAAPTETKQVAAAQNDTTEFKTNKPKDVFSRMVRGNVEEAASDSDDYQPYLDSRTGMPRMGRKDPGDGKLKVGNVGSGSHKGDGPEYLDTIVEVNPAGTVIGGNLVREVIGKRHREGWAFAQHSMFECKTRDRIYWFWTVPTKKLDGLLNLLPPRGKWTLDKIRVVNCYAYTGENCKHVWNECPGLVSLGLHHSSKTDTGDGKEAVGDVGAGSHKGDGPDRICPCENPACGRPSHHHRKPRVGGPAAKPGAAQRIAKTVAQLNQEWEICLKDGNPAALADCPKKAQPHGHRMRTAKGVLSFIDGLEDLECSQAERASMRREEKTGLSAQALPPSGECSVDMNNIDDVAAFVADEKMDDRHRRYMMQHINKLVKSGRAIELKRDEDVDAGLLARSNRNAMLKAKEEMPYEEEEFDEEDCKHMDAVYDFEEVLVGGGLSRPRRAKLPSKDECKPPMDAKDASGREVKVQPLFLAAPKAAPKNKLPNVLQIRPLLAAPIAMPPANARAAMPAPIAAPWPGPNPNPVPPLAPPRPPPPPPPNPPVVVANPPLRPGPPPRPPAPPAPPPGPPPGPPAAPAVPAPIPAAPPANPAQAHLDNLRDKACMAFLSKNLASEEDRMAVVRSLTAIARKDNVHQHVPNLTQALTDMVNDAATHVLRNRIDAARRRAIKTTGITYLEWFMRGLAFYQPDPTFHIPGEPAAAYLNRLEQIPPYSVIAINTVPRAFVLFGKAHLCFIAPLYEETLKYIVSSTATKYIIKVAGRAMLGKVFVGSQLFVGVAFGVWEAAPFLRTELIPYEVKKGITIYKVALHTLLAAVPLFVAPKGGAKFYIAAVLTHSLWNLCAAVLTTRWNINNVACSMLSEGAQLYLKEKCKLKPADFGMAKVLYDVCLDEYKVPIARTQPGFRMRQTDEHCKPVHGSSGFWGIAGMTPVVFRMCSHNERISLCGRVGKFLPMHVNPGTQALVLAEWRRVAVDFLQTLERLKIPFCYQPMPYEAWCSTFPPARRDLMLQIAKEVRDMPPLTAKSFIKRELTVKDESDPVFKDPRWIQGCPPELSAAVGPYLKKWVKKLKWALEPKEFTRSELVIGRQIVYTCGMSANAIGDSFAKAIECISRCMDVGDQIVFVEDDQSRFDLHLSKGPFKMLSAIYRRYLPRKRANLLKRGKSRGTSCLGTTYSIDYTMQSGWPDTSCGDTLVNAAMKYDIHGRGRNWISIICGDDSVTVTTLSELRRMGGENAMTARYAAFGMEVEIKVSNHPLDVEFCSGRFHPHGDTYILMPKAGKLLAKLCWDQVQRNGDNRAAWLRGIAETLRVYGMVDPLLDALGVMLCRELGEGRVLRERSNEYRAWFEQGTVVSSIDVATYYDHHYGLSNRDIRELSDIIATSSIGSFLGDSRLVAMAQQDS